MTTDGRKHGLAAPAVSNTARRLALLVNCKRLNYYYIPTKYVQLSTQQRTSQQLLIMEKHSRCGVKTSGQTLLSSSVSTKSVFRIPGNSTRTYNNFLVHNYFHTLNTIGKYQTDSSSQFTSHANSHYLLF